MDVPTTKTLIVRMLFSLGTDEAEELAKRVLELCEQERRYKKAKAEDEKAYADYLRGN